MDISDDFFNETVRITIEAKCVSVGGMGTTKEINLSVPTNLGSSGISIIADADSISAFSVEVLYAEGFYVVSTDTHPYVVAQYVGGLWKAVTSGKVLSEVVPLTSAFSMKDLTLPERFKKDPGLPLESLLRQDKQKKSVASA